MPGGNYDVNDVIYFCMDMFYFKHWQAMVRLSAIFVSVITTQSMRKGLSVLKGNRRNFKSHFSNDVYNVPFCRKLIKVV